MGRPSKTSAQATSKKVKNKENKLKKWLRNEKL